MNTEAIAWFIVSFLATFVGGQFVIPYIAHRQAKKRSLEEAKRMSDWLNKL